jgi:hypothetical protein
MKSTVDILRDRLGFEIKEAGNEYGPLMSGCYVAINVGDEHPVEVDICSMKMWKLLVELVESTNPQPAT